MKRPTRSPLGSLDLMIAPMSPETLPESCLADQLAAGLDGSDVSNRINVSEKSAQRMENERILLEGFSPSALTWKNLDWPVWGWIIGMHVGCLAAPFFFSWSAVGVAVFLWWVTGSLGICLGYHRYLSHRGFKLASPVRFVMMVCGCLAAQGSPMRWAANHRLHHAKSDQPGDPHSPHDGNWWSHILWVFVHHDRKFGEILYKKFIPDLLDDPMMNFFEKTFIFWSIGLAVALYAIGGMPWLIWGLCVRMAAGYHFTWFVNSATHLWGYRTYDEVKDDSKNLWWVAIVSFGEGWHNNHHAHPRLARAGHQWWELDPTFWVIRMLQFVGLATDVQDKIPSRALKPNRGNQPLVAPVPTEVAVEMKGGSREAPALV